jgi:hypothetical protein
MIMTKNHTNEVLAGWLLVGFLALTASASAQQEVFVPPTQSPVPPQQQFGVQMVADPSLQFAPPPDSPFQWGSLVLKPHFLYRFLYGNGIQATPGHQLTTATNSFSPGFLLDMGSRWTLDYTPTWSLYSNSAFHDTLGEAVTLAGAISFDDSTLQLNQSYVYFSEPLVETGRQTSQQDFTTRLDLSHRFNQQLFTETILSQDLRYAVGFPSSNEWSALDWLHYQSSQQLDTAIGAGLGYVDVSEGSETFYFQPEALATWAPSSKLSIKLTGGLDYREFLEHPRVTLDTPIYNVTLQYNPFEWTGLGFTAGRQVAVSYFANESTKNTVWRATLSQRLLEHFLLMASVGQNKAAYLSDSTSGSAGRNDEYLSYNLRLTWSFLQRGTLAVLYQWDRNSSTASGFGFSSHQVGLELGYRY